MIQSAGREPSQSQDISYIPMNVRMIRVVMGQGKPYTLDGVSVNHITLVARLQQFDQMQGSYEFQVQDETGFMKCKIFKPQNKSIARAMIGFSPILNSYVHLIGNIMNFSGDDVIIVDRITNIEEYQYVVLHRTQIIWADMIRRGMIHATSQSSAMQNLENKFGEADNSRGSGARLVDPVGFEALQDNTQRTIVRYVNNFGDRGVALESILSSLNLPRNIVQEHLKTLVEYGYMFTKADNNIYYTT